MPQWVAIVTGAGKGLGRAYAERLAANGAAVVVNNRWTDRDEPSSAESVAAAIRAAGGAAVANVMPVEDLECGDALVAQALAEFGRLDAVVANAGVSEAARMRRQTPEEFIRIHEINFLGSWRLVRAAWRPLTDQRGGRIVVSTSTAGLHGGDGMAAYASSKAALIGLMRALAVEGKAYDLCVNAIAPYAATGMTRPFLHANLAATMPPEQVAPLVAWLAGPDCDVSGQTFVAGGGGLSAAFAVEGPRVELGASVGEAVHRALLARPWRAFDDSHAAFAEFLHPGVQFPA